MHLRHHEKQMTNISYHLEELSFHRIEKMRERFINDQIIIPGEFDEFKIKLEKARSQLSVLQKKQLTPRNEIAFTPKKGSIKMHLRHHEKQMTNISYHLEELSFHRIEKMRERFINDQIIIPGEFDEFKIKLEKARSQLSVLQKKQLTPRNEIAFTLFRISNLENIIEEIRACHQIN
nr:hypothetical protein [Tanacetum cinerariifolium]